ncbi:MAG: 3-phosphoshikimate 1-carboxyvinyltransferase [Bacteroidia bacterium]|jgi:3-phosphoshikimate 1-carboxyvinyltransferase
MSIIGISHPSRKLQGQVNLPASKSISNRLLILQQLFPGRISIDNLSQADDSIILQQALTQKTGSINLKNAGTCLRFLLAYFSITPGEVILHGTERLHQRPVGELINALRLLGAEIDCIDKEGFAPLRIRGKKLHGGSISMQAAQSSQHASALMLIAPALEDGLVLTIEGESTSASYLEMTEKLMYDCGFIMEVSEQKYDIPPQWPRNVNVSVEPDWSAASYWYCMTCLSIEADLHMNGLTRSYLQGDVAIANYMEHFGVQSHFNEKGVRLAKSPPVLQDAQYNMNEQPDLVPAMAVAFAALGVNAKFEHIAHLRFKESDRLKALETELNRCGFKAVAGIDNLQIIASQPDLTTTPCIQTYGDHRMAMAFAPLALVWDELQIENPEVVEKSYPGFWDELKKVGFLLRTI